MISVMIPVYNEEWYLHRCLDSVTSCSGCDLEIVIVDDGSTDGSLRICREYAQRDSRIRVFHQEHKGVSAARNRGLDLCRGQWVVFVDADDFITPDLFSEIVKRTAEDPDLILFDYSVTRAGLGGAGAESRTARGREAMLDLAGRVMTLQQLRRNGNANFRSACAKAFKKSLLDQYGIRFSTSLFFGEDLLFHTEYLLRAESYVYVPKRVYYYDVHSDSSSHRFSLTFLENHARLLEELRQALEDRGALPLLETEFSCYVLSLITSALVGVVFSPRNAMGHQEKVALCEQIQENRFCKTAIARRLQKGTLKRQILMFFFRIRWYWMTGLLCRLEHLRWERRMHGLEF